MKPHQVFIVPPSHALTVFLVERDPPSLSLAFFSRSSRIEVPGAVQVPDAQMHSR